MNKRLSKATTKKSGKSIPEEGRAYPMTLCNSSLDMAKQ